MQVEIVPVGDVEQADEVDRVLVEHPRPVHRQAAAFQHEAGLDHRRLGRLREGRKRSRPRGACFRCSASSLAE